MALSFTTANEPFLVSVRAHARVRMACGTGAHGWRVDRSAMGFGYYRNLARCVFRTRPGIRAVFCLAGRGRSESRQRTGGARRISGCQRGDLVETRAVQRFLGQGSEPVSVDLGVVDRRGYRADLLCSRFSVGIQLESRRRMGCNLDLESSCAIPGIGRRS